MWLDVSVPAEARLTVKDYGDRFVVRRLPLARGLDEVGRFLACKWPPHHLPRGVGRGRQFSPMRFFGSATRTTA